MVTFTSPLTALLSPQFGAVAPFAAGTNVVVAANAAGALYVGDATGNLVVLKYYSALPLLGLLTEPLPFYPPTQ